MVGRGAKKKGAFKKLHEGILTKNTFSLIETAFSVEKNNYYVIQAIDTANNISRSIMMPVILIDSVPPEKPIISSIEIDSSGATTFTIKLNKGKGLMGYRLFRSNCKSHEFSLIKDSFVSIDSQDVAVQTIFKDSITLKMLTKNAYYRVKALDFHYNQSEFSDIYTVARPDIIPPVSPVFKGVRTFEDKVELFFILSNSNYVKEQYQYRKLPEAEGWTKFTTLKKIRKFMWTKMSQKELLTIIRLVQGTNQVYIQIMVLPFLLHL